MAGPGAGTRPAQPSWNTSITRGAAATSVKCLLQPAGLLYVVAARPLAVLYVARAARPG